LELPEISIPETVSIPEMVVSFPEMGSIPDEDSIPEEVVNTKVIDTGKASVDKPVVK